MKGLEEYDKTETVVAWTNRGHWFVTHTGLDEDGGHHTSHELIKKCLNEGDGEYVTGVRVLENEDHGEAFFALAEALLSESKASRKVKTRVMKVIKLLSEKIADQKLKFGLMTSVVRSFL